MKKRTKEQGRAMNEVQRQTTERTHAFIVETWSDYTTKCECGGYIQGEQSTKGKYYEECLKCGHVSTNVK